MEPTSQPCLDTYRIPSKDGNGNGPPPLPVEPKIDPVCRSSRRKFVYVVVGFCLLTSLALSFLGKDNKTTQIVAEGIINLAMFLSMAYIAGSAWDYSSQTYARFKVKHNNSEISKG